MTFSPIDILAVLSSENGIFILFLIFSGIVLSKIGKWVAKNVPIWVKQAFELFQNMNKVIENNTEVTTEVTNVLKTTEEIHAELNRKINGLQATVDELKELIATHIELTIDVKKDLMQKVCTLEAEISELKKSKPQKGGGKNE